LSALKCWVWGLKETYILELPEDIMLNFNRFRDISSHVHRNVRGDAYYSQVYRHGALGKRPDCCTGQTHSGERFLERRGDCVAGLRNAAVPCSEPYLGFGRTDALGWDCMDECVVSHGAKLLVSTFRLHSGLVVGSAAGGLVTDPLQMFCSF